MPAFFYGTAWKEERTRELTELALSAGFRAIDTANQRKHYLEAGVGDAVAAAIAAGRCTRGDLFLETKFTYARGQDHRLPYDPAADTTTQVAQSFASSLEHLHTDYVDALLLHGPSHTKGISPSDWQAWHAMEELAQTGKARLLGISNVSLDQLTALEAGARMKPAFVQNRCYARGGWDREVRAFCRAHDIAYQGFSLLTANQRELTRPAMTQIARRVQRPVSAVVFCFALQVGMIPLTGTTSLAHMHDDLASFDFELSADELRSVEEIGDQPALGNAAG